MVTATQIIDLVDAIVAVDRPDAVVLFGSYAYGTPTPDSDVDLLVVRDYEGASPYRAAAIEGRLVGVPFPFDLIVRSRSEIARRIGMNDWFLKDITEGGITLYVANDPGMGEQGRVRLRHRCRGLSGSQKGVAQADPEHGDLRPGLLSRPAVR